MDKHQLVAERERANQARQIIESPLWLEARETITQTMMQAWRDTAVAQEAEREKIWLMLNAAELAFSHIESVMTTGKLAEMQLKEAEARETEHG